MNKKSNGFSMIELLITLVIMGILSSIAYSSYVSSVIKTKRSQAKSSLMQLMQQEERFYTQNNSYIVFSQASTDANEKKFKWYSGDTATSSSYEITATACTGDTIQNCVLLTAVPGTANVDSNFKDLQCGNFTMTSTGVKNFSGTNGSKDICW
ncbi:type IV pilin protein [Undibacterium sp. RuTC16W]|uniref:type IV pilin protein n=1 Tax=Undibacterium sp. RuTC16W TaxID=3413048 RepID=UPI003BF43ACE